MKTKLLGLAIIAGIIFTGCQKEELTPQTEQDSNVTLQELKHGDAIPNSYIVVYKETGKFRSIEQNFFDAKSALQRDFSSKNESLERLYDEKVNSFRNEYELVLNDLSIPAEAIEHVYTGSVYGVAAKLTPEEAEVLKMDKRVDFVEPNRYVELSYITEGEAVTSEKAQTTPWVYRGLATQTIAAIWLHGFSILAYSITTPI